MHLSDFAQRCGYWPEKEEVVRARLDALGLLVTCRRCKGTGRYEHNPLDPTCYGCAGRGKKLPPLTARLAATIRGRVEQGDLKPYFAELAQLAQKIRDSRSDPPG